MPNAGRLDGNSLQFCDKPVKALAVIPARGGSKGVRGKNKYPVAGRPLIEYTIEAALTSTRLDKICVSTDDPEIKEIAVRYGRILLHERRNEHAGDASPVSATIEAVLENFNFQGVYDAVVLLQPTSPIRTAQQIDDAVKLFEQATEANSLISVCMMNDVHPARMYWKDGNLITPILKEFEETRRQDIPPAYFRNGSIYITRMSAFLMKKTIMVKPSIAFEMPSSQLLNIDEPRDLLIAGPLIEAWKAGVL